MVSNEYVVISSFTQKKLGKKLLKKANGLNMGRFCIPALDGFFFLPFFIIKRLLLQPQQEKTTYKRRQLCRFVTET